MLNSDQKKIFAVERRPFTFVNGQIFIYCTYIYVNKNNYLSACMYRRYINIRKILSSFCHVGNCYLYSCVE